VVGRRLQELGRARQVLCVTHLPQVAAQAGTHLLVSKDTVEGSKTDGPITRSRIRPLDTAGRVTETARMLGGATVTATTLQHAEEMVAQGVAQAATQDVRGGHAANAGAKSTKTGKDSNKDADKDGRRARRAVG